MPSRRVGVSEKLTQVLTRPGPPGRSRSFSDIYASTIGRPNYWIPELHHHEPAADVHDNNYEYNGPASDDECDGAYPDKLVRAQYVNRAPQPLHVERVIPAADDDYYSVSRDDESMSAGSGRTAHSAGSRRSAGSSRSMISRVSSGRGSDSVRTAQDRQILVRELQAEMEHETMTPSEVRYVARTAGLLPTHMDGEDSLQAKIEERRHAKGKFSNRSAKVLEVVKKSVTNVSNMESAKFAADGTPQARKLDNGDHPWHDTRKPVYKDYTGHMLGSKPVERGLNTKPRERNTDGIPYCPSSRGSSAR